MSLKSSLAVPVYDFTSGDPTPDRYVRRPLGAEGISLVCALLGQ